MKGVIRLFCCLLFVGLAQDGQAKTMVCHLPELSGVRADAEHAKRFFGPHEVTTDPSKAVIFITVVKEGTWADHIYLHSNFKKSTQDHPTKIATSEKVDLETLISNIMGPEYSYKALREKVKIYVDPRVRYSEYSAYMDFEGLLNIYDVGESRPLSNDNFSPIGAERDRILKRPKNRNVIFDDWYQKALRDLDLEPRDRINDILDSYSNIPASSISAESKLARSELKQTQVDLARRELTRLSIPTEERNAIVGHLGRQIDQYPTYTWRKSMVYSRVSAEREEYGQLAKLFGGSASLASYRSRLDSLVDDLVYCCAVQRAKTRDEVFSQINDVRATRGRESDRQLVEWISKEGQRNKSWVEGGERLTGSQRTADQAVVALREANGLGSILKFDGETRDLMRAKLSELLTPIKQVMSDLEYRYPQSDQPSEWVSFIRKFQTHEGLPESGSLDAATRNWIDYLNVASNELPNVVKPDTPFVEGTKVGASIFDPAVDVTYLHTTQEMASRLQRAFEGAVGEGVFDVYKRDDGTAVLALVDTRQYGLRKDIEELIRTDEIGIGLVQENGTAIFTYSGKGSGKTVVYKRNASGFDVQVVDQKHEGGWQRVVSWFGISAENRGKQKQTLDSLISMETKSGARFLVAPFEAAQQIEAMSTVPVVRVAAQSKETSQIVHDVKKALATSFSPRNTTIVEGLPKDRQQFEQLRDSTPGFNGNWGAWSRVTESILSVVKRSDFRHLTYEGRSKKSAARRIRNALAKEDNVLVLVAHGDGKSLYFPGRKGPDSLSAADLSAAQAKIRKKRPVVVLLSCSSASNNQALAASLVDLGARLVIAPKFDIESGEVIRFLSDTLSESEVPRSLLERVVEDENQDAEGMLLKLIVHDKGTRNYETS